MAVTARAAALRAQGRDVIGLGAGEPDFDTPEHIKEAAAKAIRDGYTKYTPVGGLPVLKDAIVEKFRNENGLEYASDQILVSCGAKQTFFNLCQALLDPGDQVVIPAPCWVSYPDIAMLADAEPVTVFAGADQGYKISQEQLEAAITDRTRLLILNSPCNPTGAAYTRSELEGFATVLRDHPQILVAVDDMYEHIYWGDEPFVTFAVACPDFYERTLTINGVSKAYAMTGWRIGYGGGPAKLIANMQKIQGQSTSNAAAVSQMAAVAALTGDQGCVVEMTKAFRERHDFVVSVLDALPGVRCRPGEGTFFAFAEATGAIAATAGIEDDVQLAEHFLDKAEVAIVPGSAFAAPGHFRLSFAAGMETLKEAIDRLGRCLAEG